MTDDPANPRQFDEKEISAILKRAAEIDGAGEPERGFGLSLAELQQVAAEAGIDPRSVVAAVAEFEQNAGGEGPNLWGGPLSLTLERTLAGEVDEATWEAMVAAIRRAFGNTGQVSVWGQALEWTHSGGTSGEEARVTVTPRDGHTQIQVFWKAPVMAVPFYIVATVLGLISMPVVFEALGLVSLAGVMLYAGIAGTLFLLARWTLSRLAAKEKRKVRGLMAQLEQIGSERAPRREAMEAEAGHREAGSVTPSLSLEDEASGMERGRKPSRGRSGYR